MNVVAQIFGFIAMVIYCISIQYNKKSKIIKLQILYNIFYLMQYLMLNAYTGVYVSLISVVNSIILYKYHSYRKKPPIIILYMIIGLTIYCGVLGYSDLISLIPIITGVCFLIALWQKKLIIFRIMCIINALMWLIYNFCIGAYVGTIGSMIQLVFSIIAFIKIDILKKA